MTEKSYYRMNAIYMEGLITAFLAVFTFVLLVGSLMALYALGAGVIAAFETGEKWVEARRQQHKRQTLLAQEPSTSLLRAAAETSDRHPEQLLRHATPVDCETD